MGDLITTRTKLKDHELFFAAMVGVRRHIESFGSKEWNKVKNPEFGWHNDIDAACGEMAVAKCLRLYWDGSFNTYKKADLENVLQVRTNTMLGGHLIVRPGDADNEVFLRVYSRYEGSGRPEFFLRGWIFGKEGKKDEYKRNPRNAYPAWFVPESALRPISGDIYLYI